MLIILPFVWMPLTSLRGSQGEIHAFLVRYPPNLVSAVSYMATLWKGNFGRYMPNSFFPLAVAATCAVFIAVLASYVMSRFHSRFRSVFLLFFLVTQMIPMFIMLVPLCQLLAKAKVPSDLRSLAIFYTNMMIPFPVVILRGFFDSVPKSPGEAT